MNEREALKLALEALESTGLMWPHIETAITAIREALAQPEHSCVACEGNPKGNNNPCAVCGMAQPEQEPVAWGMMNDDGKIYDCICPEEHDRVEGEYTVPLYTTPPHRKPLTDEEIDKLPWEPHESNPMTFAEGLRYFARAIEAAHGIKE